MQITLNPKSYDFHFLHLAERDAAAAEDLDTEAKPCPLSDVWRESFTWTEDMPWRARGFGKAAWVCWRLMKTRPGLSARELAEVRQVGVHAVRKQLAKLERCGLAKRDEAGRWWPGAATEDDVAEKMGLAGASAEQHRRHAVEREAWYEHLSLRLIRGRCAADGELIAFEIACEFDLAVAAARVLPGAWWDRRRRVWVVPRSRPAAAALVQFARTYGFGFRADAQAALDDAEATAQRRDGEWRAR